MAAAVRDERERERDFVDLANWYMLGWTHYRMAEELTAKYYAESNRLITRRQVTFDIAEIIKRWRDKAATQVDQRKAEELARIDRIEAEYWSAWERSKSTRTVITKSGDEIEITPDGDPRFLEGIKGCVDMRIRIFGLYAPTRQIVDYKELSDEQLIARVKERLAGIGLASDGGQSPQVESGRQEED